ncbi:SDR family oxidoreductase [soil metagenome]
MTVTIFGATGMVGSQLITHAMTKGWIVKAFGRSVETLIDKDLHTENFKAIKGYVFDAGEVKHALKGSDAVLSALGGGFTGTDKSRSLGIKNIIAQMKVTGVHRIVALGGQGILPDKHGDLLMDATDYPPELIPVSMEHRQAYQYLKESDLDWTLVCPHAITEAAADNNFITAAEAATDGYRVSAGNLALFMVEELERNAYPKERVGISNT